MSYLFIVYYSWMIGLGFWIGLVKHGRPGIGFLLILVAALLQSGAHGYHVLESLRIAGEPDSIYGWIIPFIIAVVGCPFWISGVIISIVPSRRGATDMKASESHLP